MIISGKYIALSKEDFVPYRDEDSPIVIWFNIDNISSLVVYQDRYILTLVNSVEAQIELTSQAASDIIHLMRNERDANVREFADRVKHESGLKQAFNEYLKRKKEEK